MTVTCAVFVEGDNDKSFLDAFLNRIGLSNFQLEVIGGGISKLPAAQPRIQRIRNAGNRIAIILDADTDIADRRLEIREEEGRLDIPVDRWFLMPDDENPGCLENLLEQIANPRHAILHDCFSRYEACLETAGRDSQYEYRLPDIKDRIYAYCAAVGNGPKEDERDYANADHWDLDARALNPLKEFLRECAAMAPPNDTV